MRWSLKTLCIIKSIFSPHFVTDMNLIYLIRNLISFLFFTSNNNMQTSKEKRVFAQNIGYKKGKKYKSKDHEQTSEYDLILRTWFTLRSILQKKISIEIRLAKMNRLKFLLYFSLENSHSRYDLYIYNTFNIKFAGG